MFLFKCKTLFDKKAKKSIYEYPVPAALRLEQASDDFYTFDGMVCRIFCFRIIESTFFFYVIEL